MRTLFIIPLVLMSLVSFPSWGADLEKGLIAAENGDFATALREIQPLAEQGDAFAQLSLGLMYARGNGVPQDDKEAVRLYRLAAEQGVAQAQLKLGLIYGNGYRVPQDNKEAVKWYRLAAEQGVARAQHNLGSMYGKGTGVVQDFIYAHMWWNIAASNGIDEGNKKKVEEMMTTSDISEAQRLARECVKKNYKGC